MEHCVNYVVYCQTVHAQLFDSGVKIFFFNETHKTTQTVLHRKCQHRRSCSFDDGYTSPLSITLPQSLTCTAQKAAAPALFLAESSPTLSLLSLIVTASPHFACFCSVFCFRQPRDKSMIWQKEHAFYASHSVPHSVEHPPLGKEL